MKVISTALNHQNMHYKQKYGRDALLSRAKEERSCYKGRVEVKGSCRFWFKLSWLLCPGVMKCFLVFFFPQRWLKTASFHYFLLICIKSFIIKKNRKTIPELNLQTVNKRSSLVCKCRWKKEHVINENQSRKRREQPCITNEDDGPALIFHWGSNEAITRKG